VLALGHTLGVGALLGATAGFAWGARGLARRLYRSAIEGRTTLVVDPDVITLIAMRHLELIATLESRGHAEQRPAELARVPAGRMPVGNTLLKAIYRARGRPGWSGYPDADARSAAAVAAIVDRERAAAALAQSLGALLEQHRVASRRKQPPAALTASAPRT
jgi:hypothetical protein